MAYVIHSPYRAYSAKRSVSGIEIGFAAIVALLAGVAVMLSVGASADGPSVTQALAKGDRIASVIVAGSASSSDAILGVASTTTVEKGATTGFSAQSPYLAATR